MLSKSSRHLSGSKRAKMVRVENRKKPTVKSVAKSVRKIQSKQELKHFDVELTAGSVDQDGLFTVLNGMAQGVDDDERIGNQISITSVQYRGVVAYTTTILSAVVARHIIFWDRQSDGATPTIGSLLDTSVINDAGNQIYCPYNIDNSYRYRVVYDKTFTLTPQTILVANDVSGTITTATVNPVLKFSRTKKKVSRSVHYTADTAGISAISTNALWSVWLTNSGTALSCTVGYRIIFKDN